MKTENDMNMMKCDKYAIEKYTNFRGNIKKLNYMQHRTQKI